MYKHKHQSLFSLLILAAMVLTACGASAPTPDTMMQDTATPDAMMMDETSTPDAMMNETPTADAMMMHETPTAAAMMNETPGAMMESPAWFGTALTNVQNDTTFTIADLNGKVVLVETMAVSCSKCRDQQNEIKALHAQLGMLDDFVSVSLDIDPNENPDTLKSYLKTTDFDWSYAVAPADVARNIASEFEDQFLNPPSPQILIIDRHGVAHALPFGLKSADDLLQAVNMYLKEGM